MLAGLVLLALAISPPLSHDDVVVEHVDLMELQHFCDPKQAEGVNYTQVLFYDWNPTLSVYQLRAWRLVKYQDQYPFRDYRRNCWISIWREGGLLREVRSPLYRETWSGRDAEQDARELLPKELRRGLRYEKGLWPWFWLPGDKSQILKHWPNS